MTRRSHSYRPVWPLSVAATLVWFGMTVTTGPAPAFGQTRPVEGLRQNDNGVHALVGARVVVAPGRVLESATVVIRDGVIESVGANVVPPPEARIREMAGNTIYPGFIDAASSVGMRSELSGAAADGEERGASYWNPQLRADVQAAGEMARDDERIAALRSQGFTVVHAIPRLGMFRGETAVMSLSDVPVADRVLRAGVTQSLALARDGEVGSGYPTSAMGAVAFIRQTLHDADWHDRAHAAYARNPDGQRRPEMVPTLAALTPAVRGEQPLFVEVTSSDELLRALAFRAEFPLAVWIRGSGHEYLNVEALRAARVPVVVPLELPAAPSVGRPEDALNVSLASLRHWHRAPENPGILTAAGVSFSFTAAGIQRLEDFTGNLRAVVEAGLPADSAIAALTTRPAALLGIQRTHGTVERGKAANLVVVNGDLLAAGSEIQDVWVDGRRYEVTAPTRFDPRGEWRVSALGSSVINGDLEISGRLDRLAGSFGDGGREVDLATVEYRNEPRRLRVTVPDVMGLDGVYTLSGTVNGDEIYGWGELPNGERFNWHATRTAGPAPAAGVGAAEGTATELATGDAPVRLTLPEISPAGEYGRAAVPAQPENLLIRNATVWTMGPDGILENADLLVRRGRIVEVGRDLSAPGGAEIIDATGRHVTPGLIDAHSHASVSGGVNETGSAIVPEVRIGDVVTAGSIAMYRQLAGGLTTAHLMHGSANPIGGQNQAIKLRWGLPPDSLRFDGAPRTVKFALGENVTRRAGRYPDTRMGVEQIMRDHFVAAREYQRDWAEWNATNRGIPPRRDLRLEAIGEILDEEILVMSHAYRQDEMLTLMRLLEEFGTRVKAFHHGVEAYKIAPELVRHGTAAAVWSDWSSFKIEAYDATTYNARVLWDAGVLTSLHSDDAQVSTRMNWEAAKMLRTGLTPEQALALVTINTAKVLGIDDRVGSLENGKDADFTIWSGDPLSTATRAEQTWIDGRRFYDREEDRRLAKEAERERALLLQLVHESR